MIGERVKKYRKEAGMTLTELADRAGVAKSYLSALERNIQKNPSVQFLEKIAVVLNISIDHLLKDNVNEPSTKAAENLDNEWKKLVLEAMESGISKEEFRNFLEYNKWKIGQK
ncbi:XRE family transcriptional regulator, master regulator for biofilm formation [Evansella caseinilytica]|uniref:XRE family transcriptional regulator, master regulator for biofilm formation n=1 Tax=Evansella caseinilytica TaxID=1503961 RepID=A0A1H3KMY8_9BACI|nr:helix-turn-helix domain-containing protein [Evansella caseinilytica]SDY53511.1 XRE family transcriptional regulator, master regulator for biofilm formation [Evansella caseinilytica]